MSNDQKGFGEAINDTLSDLGDVVEIRSEYVTLLSMRRGIMRALEKTKHQLQLSPTFVNIRGDFAELLHMNDNLDVAAVPELRGLCAVPMIAEEPPHDVIEEPPKKNGRRKTPAKALKK